MQQESIDWNDYFIYDPSSPTFLINKIKRSQRARKGGIAGTVGTKEIHVNFKGGFYRHARIIWEMHHGKIQGNNTVGTLDGNPFNLLIENLVLRTPRERGLNTRQRLGELGVRGVTKQGNSYLAHAKINGKTVYLGSYPTIKAASNARKFALRFKQE